MPRITPSEQESLTTILPFRNSDGLPQLEYLADSLTEDLIMAVAKLNWCFVSSRGLWMTTVDGITVLIGPRDHHRPSQDQRWHICMGPGDMDDAGPKIYCIFEPSNG